MPNTPNSSTRRLQEAIDKAKRFLYELEHEDEDFHGVPIPREPEDVEIEDLRVCTALSKVDSIESHKVNREIVRALYEIAYQLVQLRKG
jgi:hypothetical protein